MGQFARGVAVLSRIFGYFAAAMTICLIVVMLIEVVSRYVLGSPTVWAFDVAYMLNGAAFMMACAMALHVNQHVTVDIFSQFFSPRVRQVIEVLTFGLLMLPALGLVSYAAWIEFWRAYATGMVEQVSPWRPVLWPFRLAIALGLSALWLQVLARVLRPVPVPPPSYSPRDAI